jgi:hypothetical protein
MLLTTALTALTALSLAAAPPALTCDGPLVPPAGYLQETAFAPDAATAATKARQQLMERTCQASPCPELAARATLWLAGQGQGAHCAMAVLEAALVEEWRAGNSARGFVATVGQRLAPVLPAPAAGGRTAVAVDRVALATNVPGAEAWVRDALQQALGALPAVKLVEPGTPKATVVRANVVERHEQQRPVLDVGVTVVRPGGELATVSATLPRAVLPFAPSPAPVTSTTPLALSVEARCERRRGGRFEPVTGPCSDTPLGEGDRYRLSIRPSEPAWIYVVAYNSRGQLQGLFPDPGVDNRLPSLTLPADGWLELDDVRDVTEHVVVVASRAPQPALEALRGIDVPSRAGGGDAAPLVATRGFVDGVRTRGFKKPTAAPGGGARQPAVDPGALVESGPGVAAVELTLAHR